MRILKADRGDDWGDMNDWASEEWERWQQERLYREYRRRSDRLEVFDEDLDDGAFEGDPFEGGWDPLVDEGSQN